MTNTRPKYADAQPASAIGLLVLALVFSPAVLVLSRPFGGASVSLAAVFSALCIVLAWFAWSRDSRRPRMSVVTQPTP
jgi:hypothetical protein